MKLFALYLLLLTVSTAVGQTAEDLEQQFPEAPQPVKHSQFGGYEIDKSKLPKPQPIFTKKWVGAHAFYLGTTVFDIEVTHQGQAAAIHARAGVAGTQPAHVRRR